MRRAYFFKCPKSLFIPRRIACGIGKPFTASFPHAQWEFSQYLWLI